MPLNTLLKGVVEVDETFVGGSGRMCSKNRRQTPVVALIERGGNMATRVVSNVTQKNLGQALHDCVDKSATVNTDEHGAYRNPLKNWKAHHTVVHSATSITAAIKTARSLASIAVNHFLAYSSAVFMAHGIM